jgi:hypothetical protein
MSLLLNEGFRLGFGTLVRREQIERNAHGDKGHAVDQRQPAPAVDIR